MAPVKEKMKECHIGWYGHVLEFIPRTNMLYVQDNKRGKTNKKLK